MPKYTKPSLPTTSHIPYLRSKGLTIKNPGQAAQFLARVGLYRFKGYAYHFIDPATVGVPGAHSKYLSGTTFHMVRRLIELDEELKLHIIKGIQTFEIHFRVVLNETLTHRHGPHWYTQPAVLSLDVPKFAARCYADFMQSKEIFVDGFKRKYDSDSFPPSWMIIEVLSLGSWSMVYKELKDPVDKTTVASTWGLHRETLKEWLQNITVLRNACAHHARVWNRVFKTMPVHDQHPAHLRANLRNHSFSASDPGALRLAPRLFALHHLVKVANGNDQWTKELKTILAKFPPHYQQDMGFRAGWNTRPEWT